MQTTRDLRRRGRALAAAVAYANQRCCRRRDRVRRDPVSARQRHRSALRARDGGDAGAVRGVCCVQGVRAYQMLVVRKSD